VCKGTEIGQGNEYMGAVIVPIAYPALVPAVRCKYGTGPPPQNLHRAFRFHPAALEQQNTD